MALTGVESTVPFKFSYKPEFTSQSELNSVGGGGFCNPPTQSTYGYSVQFHVHPPVAIEWKIYSECVCRANKSAVHQFQPPNSIGLSVHAPLLRRAGAHLHPVLVHVVIMNY